MAVVAGAASVAVVAGAVVSSGHFLTAKSTAAAAAVNMNCTLVVPANPLTAQGLATPYQLTATNPAAGPCNEANPNQAAFVQGAVINPATGQISVYNPVVVDAGTQPAITPTAPVLPAGGVVALWFGFNGNTLSFAGADQVGQATAATTATPAMTATAPATTAPATTGPTATAPATGPTTTVTTPTATTTSPAATATSLTTAPATGTATTGASTTGASTTGTVTAIATATAVDQALIVRSGGHQHDNWQHNNQHTRTSPTASATTATGTSTVTTPVVTGTTGGTGTVTTPVVTGTQPAAGTNTPAASGTPDAILQQSNCITGEDIAGAFSSFTQVGACNAVAFFQAANAAIQAGKLTVPNPGNATDGQQCLTTRNFGIIDQDQSDNVTTEYLVNGNGQLAQDTAANAQALGGTPVVLANGSDNGLIDFFVDPALGCTPWKVPNLADNGTTAPALPLDELQAAAFAGQSGGPAALVPLNDPMVLGNNGNQSTAKANAYRSIMDQPALPAGETPAEYCGDMESIQGVRLQQDVNLLIGKTSPAPAMADNLFTFLAMRLQQSFGNLNCQNFGLRNDVSTTVNGNGVVVAACFLQQVNAVTPGAGNPTRGMTVCPATSTAGTPTATASATPTGTSTGTSTGTTPTATATAPTMATTPPAPRATGRGGYGTVPGGNAGTATRKHHHWWW